MRTDWQAPRYNVGAVVQATGITPDRLRVWERRYGLPRPKRTPGGHRLYSQYDIALLRWLLAREQEGLSIGRAADLYRQLQAQGEDPLRQEPTSGLAPTLAGGSIEELRDRWIAACLAFDEQTARNVTSQAFALFPADIVCTEVLQKGLSRIGEAWYRGEVSVQQEHFASELAVRRLERLIVALPPPSRTGRVVVGCPPGETHTFSLLVMTLLLRQAGWHAIFLGADVPLDDLDVTVLNLEVHLVVLAAQRLPTAATLLQGATLLQRHKVLVAYGGGVFARSPELRVRLPAHYLGEDLRQAAREVESLLSVPALVPSARPATREYDDARSSFVAARPTLDARVRQSLERAGFRRAQAAIAVENLGDDIEAALYLGDITFVNPELRWLEGLLAHRRTPATLLSAFLATYHDEASRVLDQGAAPVLSWLSRMVAEMAGRP